MKTTCFNRFFVNHAVYASSTMNMKSMILTAVITVITTVGSAHAGGDGFPQQIGKIKMDSYTNLPSPGSLIAVQQGNRLLITSGNGRYIIMGAVYDMWNGGQRIKNIEEAKAASRKIRLDKIGLNFKDLSAFDIGDNSGPEYVVFADPTSEQSMRMIKELYGIKGYKVKVVVVGIMGKDGANKTISLACLAEKNLNKAKDALASGNLSFVPKSKCEQGRIKTARSLATAMMFGVDRLPFIVAPNGNYFFGRPNDLRKFLKENEQ